MKKIVSLILLLMICFSLVGCGNDKTINGKAKVDDTNIPDTNENDKKEEKPIEQTKYNRFNGTYAHNDARIIINNLDTNSTIQAYYYSSKEWDLSSGLYSAGYWQLEEIKIKCNDTLDNCTRDDYKVSYVFNEDGTITYGSWNYKKISDDISLPEKSVELQRKEPRIGMTAEEVEKSTCGKTSTINRTTTSYGVKEQWVYTHIIKCKVKYIYLENGIVTAIQD